MTEQKTVKFSEGYEIPCASGKYNFIYRKYYQAIVKKTIKSNELYTY